MSAFLYRTCLAPLLILVFRCLAPLGHKKIRAGWKMRARDKDGAWPWLATAPGLRPVWIHCASFEFEYAKPVIARLKSERPDLKILVTYFSPTVAKAAHNFAGVDFACPTPLESGAAWAEFLRFHRPQALLIARTDTWPEMLRQTKTAGVPSLLFSATLSSTSGRARGLGRWLSRLAFSYLDTIYCVDEADRRTFANLGFPAEVQGDTRFDQVLARLKSAKPLRELVFADLKKRSLFIAGSTWDEDEAVLIQAAAQLKDRLIFVFVPHEPTPEHLEALERKLKEAKLEPVRYSTASGALALGEACVVDKIGILAELYQKGDFAFVGGSFRKTVHSVMEPLAAGCLTFVGPLHLNNREALDFLKVPAGVDGLHCVEKVRSAAELTTKIKTALDSKDFGPVIQAEVEKRSGRSKAVVDWVLSRLKTD